MGLKIVSLFKRIIWLTWGKTKYGKTNEPKVSKMKIY